MPNLLARSMKMAFWVTYDHLGKLMVASLIGAAALAVPAALAYTALLTAGPGIGLVLGLPILAVTLAFILPVTSAGLAHLAKELIDTGDGSMATLWAGMGLYWKRASALGLFYCLAGACLVTSFWFYTVKLNDSLPWLGYALSGLAGWALIFLGLMALFVIPALVQKKAGVLQTLRLAALLVLDNPLFTVGLAIQMLVLTLLVFLPPLFVLIYGAFSMVLTTSAYEMLARKYARQARDAVLQAKPLVINGLADSRETRSLLREDEDDDYLNRGFQDLFFPWKQ